MGDNKDKPKKPSKGKPSEADDDDFDSICNAFAACNSKCNVAGCRGSSVILLQTCQLCRTVYCLGHRLPEDHGCSKAAKEKAKRDAVKPRPNTSGPARQERERAEKALRTKLAEKEKLRARKTKSS